MEVRFDEHLQWVMAMKLCRKVRNFDFDPESMPQMLEQLDTKYRNIVIDAMIESTDELLQSLE